MDYLVDENSNSIGALLLHIASLEYNYQLATFDQRIELTDEEMKLWGAAMELGERARSEIRGYPFSHYMEVLHDIRLRTLDEFRKRSDDWLFEEIPGFWGAGKTGNNYFAWFHVFEDELNHRGQIRTIIKRLPHS